MEVIGIKQSDITISGPAVADEGAAELQAAVNPAGDDECFHIQLAEETCCEAAPSRLITAPLIHKHLQ